MANTIPATYYCSAVVQQWTPRCDTTRRYLLRKKVNGSRTRSIPSFFVHFFVHFLFCTASRTFVCLIERYNLEQCALASSWIGDVRRAATVHPLLYRVYFSLSAFNTYLSSTSLPFILPSPSIHPSKPFLSSGRTSATTTTNDNNNGNDNNESRECFFTRPCCTTTAASTCRRTASGFARSPSSGRSPATPTPSPCCPQR